jgi:hypothetical protein
MVRFVAGGNASAVTMGSLRSWPLLFIAVPGWSQSTNSPLLEDSICDLIPIVALRHDLDFRRDLLVTLVNRRVG